MPNGEVFIAPEGTPPDSDEWQQVGFTDTSQWVARELFADVYRRVREAMADPSRLGWNSIAVTREQYEILYEDARRREMERPFPAWLPTGPGPAMIFGTKIVVLPQEFPPPPGCLDARPEHRWAPGQRVQSQETMVVSDAIASDEETLGRIKARFLTNHGLPESWPCQTSLREIDPHRLTYELVLTPAPWTVGRTAQHVEWQWASAPVHSFEETMRPQAPRRGRRDGEGWSDYIDRIADTSEMDSLLGDISDSMSMTYDGTEGEYPF